MKLKKLLHFWPQAFIGLLYVASVLLGVWTLCNTYGLQVIHWWPLVIGSLATWFIALVIGALNLYLKVR